MSSGPISKDRGITIGLAALFFGAGYLVYAKIGAIELATVDVRASARIASKSVAKLEERVEVYGQKLDDIREELIRLRVEVEALKKQEDR